MADETLAAIKKARERVHHWKQWKNEPACKRKLGRWQRRLAKAIKQARSAKLTIPPDPFAPPPPPPTEEELRTAAIKDAKARVPFEWQACVGKDYWAPWGNSGWSAVVLTKLNRVWCRASRVDPRTGEITTHKGKVRRDRLVRRDPALKGKDRPAGVPDEIVPPPSAKPAEVTPAPEAAVPKPGVEPLTSEAEAERTARFVRLLSLLDDDSTTADW